MAKSNGVPTTALNKFMAGFEKSFGSGSIIVPQKPSYETISTGSVGLDQAMGAGGYVEGRMTELWGPPSGGKSTLCSIAAGNAQRKHPDKLVGWIDIERTFDGDWAEKLGMDLNRTHLVEPVNAEDVADMIKEMLQSGMYSMITLDSIGAMLPKEEFEKDAGQASMGTIAKVITRMVKISAVYAKQYNVALNIINQQRANFGYGADTTRPGGFALTHGSTHRLNVKRGENSYKIGTPPNDVQVGYDIAVRVEKNKIAPPQRQARFRFFNQPTALYGPLGIDRTEEAFTIGSNYGIINRAGAWYTLPDGERFQGKNPAVIYLKEHPDLVEQIRSEALKAVSDDLVSDEPVGEIDES